jgi:hypothetical protein
MPSQRFEGFTNAGQDRDPLFEFVRVKVVAALPEFARLAFVQFQGFRMVKYAFTFNEGAVLKNFEAEVNPQIGESFPGSLVIEKFGIHQDAIIVKEEVGFFKIHNR